MSEVNQDPIAKLAQFTPANPANRMEILFAAGRASARTFWGWKAAVAGLLVANLALVGALTLRTRDVPVPIPPPQAEPTRSAPAEAAPELSPNTEPWSLHTMRSTGFDAEVKPALLANSPTQEPLTALAARNLNFD